MSGTLQATNPAADARRSPAHARLREATRALHAAVDGLFPRGLASLADYRRYVLGMHRFAADHERAVDAPPRRSAWLARDLSSLALHPLPALGACRPQPEQATRLGWEYVMAGSSLGARALLRDAGRLGLDPASGACFLERHATGDDWPALQARLRSLDAGDETRMAQAEAGARAAFARVRACFDRAFDRLPSLSDDLDGPP